MNKYIVLSLRTSRRVQVHNTYAECKHTSLLGNFWMSDGNIIIIMKGDTVRSLATPRRVTEMCDAYIVLPLTTFRRLPVK